eukprot:1072043-Amphidinium_carterae.1
MSCQTLTNGSFALGSKRKRPGCCDGTLVTSFNAKAQVSGKAHKFTEPQGKVTCDNTAFDAKDDIFMSQTHMISRTFI